MQGVLHLRRCLLSNTIKHSYRREENAAALANTNSYHVHLRAVVYSSVDHFGACVQSGQQKGEFFRPQPQAQHKQCRQKAQRSIAQTSKKNNRSHPRVSLFHANR
ncbi:unnamed protein product [Ectocarpus sp. 12 AP-2014]